jgi:hypothetical protein
VSVASRERRQKREKRSICAAIRRASDAPRTPASNERSFDRHLPSESATNRKKAKKKQKKKMMTKKKVFASGLTSVCEKVNLMF